MKWKMILLGVVLGCMGGLRVRAGTTGALSETRRITVSGVCHREVTSDRGSVHLTAEAQDHDLRVATKKAASSYERVRESVKKLGLEDIELRTVEYTVAEIREWENNKQVFKGFRARVGLRVVTSQVERLGEVIAIASREGLKEVGGLQSFLSDQKQLAEEISCLKEAAENARQKAEKLASALGSKVGEVLTVSESGGFQFPQQRMMMGMDQEMGRVGRSSAPPVPSIEPGQQSLKLTVEVSFGLL